MRLPASLRRLLQDRKGSLLSTFSLSFLGITVLTGGILDVGVAQSAKLDMQQALDATALAVAKEGYGKTSAQIQSAADTHFRALFTNADVKNTTVTATMQSDDAGGSTVTVTGAGTVQTTFLSLAGIPTIDVGATAVAAWGSTRLRVALVLDNTGSMSNSGKLAALKTAGKNLLTQLQTASKSAEDVYVSIIPFSRNVNVGTGNVSASWIRWTEWDAANGSYNWRGTWIPASHSTWNGCVMDRDQDYDTKNTAPTTASSATLYPAQQYSSCPVPVMALSNDWTALNAKIDAMAAAGNTNQAIGLQWGWSSLTTGPLAVPAIDAKYKYQTVVILLSDGLNTENRWTSSTSSIDARQKKTCDNIKAAGIMVYTVQVNTGNDPKSTLLEGCATDTSKFFYLTSATQIISTFGTIGTSLSQLRLSK
ncbi:pilus assembly protein TadG [Prosthecomicrobium hirschii]|uniref:TadE/TadG family type IV pilus assembly protein n=1 Tax=Prosthecodimorpha hirschii TaxID=665126 RepID=UPI00112D53E0|nr:VWA domain-containing protein [Prosthecomicrobium hirschii]TPQ49668.1 pilus assembly protein TadG [Prosthecomicrobium hirschii]